MGVFCVCAPIVVVGAPLGSVLGSYVHRLVLAAFVYATDFVQLIGALIVVQPWSREKCTKELAPAKEMALGPDTCNPTHLCWSSAAIFVCGLIAFWVMRGRRKADPEKHGDGKKSPSAKLKSAELVTSPSMLFPQGVFMLLSGSAAVQWPTTWSPPARKKTAAR